MLIVGDKEIVNALNCVLQLNNGLDKNNAIIALDLINRLQERDETRHKVFETKCEELEIAKAENEKLKDLYEKSAYEREMFLNELNNAKVEAYKEFWKELHQLGRLPEDISDNFAVGYSAIDNLYKELVGDNNESTINQQPT